MGPLRAKAVDQRKPLAEPRSCLSHTGSYVILCTQGSRSFLPPPRCWQTGLSTGNIHSSLPCLGLFYGPQAPPAKVQIFKVLGNGGDFVVIFPFSREYVEKQKGAVKQVTLPRSGCPVLEDKPSPERSQVAPAEPLA